MTARYADDDPVLAELLRLHDERHWLVPEDVVDEAKVPSNPLHGEFTWDDTEAAKQHRLNEARQLIRRYKIQLYEPAVEVRRFTSVETNDGRGYMETTDVLDNAFLRKQVLDRMEREARAWTLRYEHYAEAAGVVEAMRTFLAEREQQRATG